MRISSFIHLFRSIILQRREQNGANSPESQWPGFRQVGHLVWTFSTGKNYSGEGLAEKAEKEKGHEENCDQRPDPAAKFCGLSLGAEFVPDEFRIIKLLVRQAKPAAVGLLRPTGFLVGSAFGTASGSRRKVSAAVGAVIHGKRRRRQIERRWDGSPSRPSRAVQ